MNNKNIKLYNKIKEMLKQAIALLLVGTVGFSLGAKKSNKENSDNSAETSISISDEVLVDITYKIVKGDTLEKIANKFNKEIEEITQANSITNGDYIIEGESIIIPNVTKELADKYNTEEVERLDITYQVQEGDTLEKIATKYEKSVDEIAKRNNITDKDSINVGQILQISDVSIIVIEQEELAQEDEEEPNRTNTVALETNSLNCKNLNEGYFRAIDISEMQKEIDWNKLEEEYKSGTFSHIILRINENLDKSGTKREFRVDDNFEKNLSECNKRGIPYGVYSLSRASTEEEVNTETTSLINYINNNLNTTKEVNGETLDLTFNLSLPIYMDCFENDAISQYNLIATGEYDTCIELVDLWCSNIEKEGYFTGVYINSNCLKSLGKENLSKYTLWIADYGNNTGIDVEKVGLTNKVTLDAIIRGHQVTSSGKINGINGDVDVSVFDGNILDIINAYYKNPNKTLTYNKSKINTD